MLGKLEAVAAGMAISRVVEYEKLCLGSDDIYVKIVCLEEFRDAFYHFALILGKNFGHCEPMYYRNINATLIDMSIMNLATLTKQVILDFDRISDADDVFYMLDRRETLNKGNDQDEE